MRVPQMLPGFLRGHGARLQHQDAGDDLKTVGDTVLQLPQQHVLLPEQLLRPPQQFFLLAFDGPPLGDLLASKKKGRAGVARVEHRAGVQEHDAAANRGKLMLDLERVHGGALRDDFLQKDAKRWNAVAKCDRCRPWRGCVFYRPFVLKCGKDCRYRWVCGGSHRALSFKMWIEEIMGSS